MPTRKTCRSPGLMRSTMKINCVPLVPIRTRRIFRSSKPPFRLFRALIRGSSSLAFSREELRLEDEFRRLETFNITYLATAIGLRLSMHGKIVQNSHNDQNDFLSRLFESRLGKTRTYKSTISIYEKFAKCRNAHSTCMRIQSRVFITILDRCIETEPTV